MAFSLRKLLGVGVAAGSVAIGNVSQIQAQQPHTQTLEEMRQAFLHPNQTPNNTQAQYYEPFRAVFDSLPPQERQIAIEAFGLISEKVSQAASALQDSTATKYKNAADSLESALRLTNALIVNPNTPRTIRRIATQIKTSIAFNLQVMRCMSEITLQAMNGVANLQNKTPISIQDVAPFNTIIANMQKLNNWFKVAVDSARLQRTASPSSLRAQRMVLELNHLLVLIDRLKNEARTTPGAASLAALLVNQAHLLAEQIAQFTNTTQLLRGGDSFADSLRTDIAHAALTVTAPAGSFVMPVTASPAPQSTPTNLLDTLLTREGDARALRLKSDPNAFRTFLENNHYHFADARLPDGRRIAVMYKGSRVRGPERCDNQLRELALLKQKIVAFRNGQRYTYATPVQPDPATFSAVAIGLAGGRIEFTPTVFGGTHYDGIAIFLQNDIDVALRDARQELERASR